MQQVESGSLAFRVVFVFGQALAQSTHARAHAARLLVMRRITPPPTVKSLLKTGRRSPPSLSAHALLHEGVRAGVPLCPVTPPPRPLEADHAPAAARAATKRSRRGGGGILIRFARRACERAPPPVCVCASAPAIPFARRGAAAARGARARGERWERSRGDSRGTALVVAPAPSIPLAGIMPNTVRRLHVTPPPPPRPRSG